MDCFDDTYSFDYHMTPEPQRDWHTRDLGTRWLMMEVLIKHWLANMWLQTPIELAHNITTKTASGRRISRILSWIPTVGRMYFPPRASTPHPGPVQPPSCWRPICWSPPRTRLVRPRQAHRPQKFWSWPPRSTAVPATPLPGAVLQGLPERRVPHQEADHYHQDGRQYSESMDCHPGHPRNMLTHREVHRALSDRRPPRARGERLERAPAPLAELERAAISPPSAPSSAANKGRMRICITAGGPKSASLSR